MGTKKRYKFNSIYRTGTIVSSKQYTSTNVVTSSSLYHPAYQKARLEIHLRRRERLIYKSSTKISITSTPLTLVLFVPWSSNKSNENGSLILTRTLRFPQQRSMNSITNLGLVSSSTLSASSVFGKECKSIIRTSIRGMLIAHDLLQISSFQDANALCGVHTTFPCSEALQMEKTIKEFQLPYKEIYSTFYFFLFVFRLRSIYVVIFYVLIGERNPYVDALNVINQRFELGICNVAERHWFFKLAHSGQEWCDEVSGIKFNWTSIFVIHNACHSRSYTTSAVEFPE
ncbi:hypothetical protein H5410_047715 [Solanum commersonii]|uniref:Uncharacterized protein n=1 Tax=Solanum commersonii TaxID=4109 RepID=A0A9J5XFX4_SOLCO|nr:hypothetical protein H5410_047715 [Solanum commersonii]